MGPFDTTSGIMGQSATSGIGSGIQDQSNSQGGYAYHLSQHQQLMQQQLVQQQQFAQQQYQYQIQYQQDQIEKERQFTEMFDALCKFVLYENNIPKEKHADLIRKCAMHILANCSGIIATQSEIGVLREIKNYVPTLKFDNEMSDLLDGEGV